MPKSNNSTHDTISQSSHMQLKLQLCGDFINEVKSMPVQDEMIEGLLPRNQVMLIAGDPWQGKSLLAQHAALSFGAGGNFHGLKMKKCRSLYITCEGGIRGLMKRFSAMRDAIKPDLDAVTYIDQPPMFINTDEGYQQMRSVLSSAKRDYNIEVVIIDSFPSTFSGNVKEDKSINQWWAKMQELIHEFDITVIVIWEVSKLPIDGNHPPEQFNLSRVKGASTIAYKVNTVIAIGELKKNERKGEVVERVSKGHRLVVLKSKDTGKMDWLEVELDPLTLTYKGQNWKYNDIDCSYKAV